MNRKNFTIFSSLSLFSVALLILLGTGKSTAALVLVNEGQSDVSIVISQNAGSRIKAAARELQSYIKQSSGAELPIAHIASGPAIHIGKTPVVEKLDVDTANLDSDGYILQGFGNDTFVILGGSDGGTELGVYDFLERYLGVRWLMLGDIGTDVPKHSRIAIPPAKIVEEPVYISRQLSPGKGTHPLAQWYRFNRVQYRIRFSHNLLNLFPVSKFGKTNPEFYPILRGKRYIPTSNADWRWQPNFSAPGIVEAAAAQIDKYFQDNPTATSYSLGMNDGNYWDESPASKARRNGKKNYLGAEDVSDDYFTWTNAVVEKVLQKHPDKWFGVLAYGGLGEAPTRVKLNPRIVPFITYDRKRWENEELRERGHQVNARWENAASVLGWYDYIYGRSYLLPRVYFKRMQENLEWGASHNAKFAYAELYPNWGEGPKPWVYAKLLWNPRQNVDVLLDEWYTSFAGKAAAPHLKDYYAVWEKFWTVDIFNSPWREKLWVNHLPFGGEPTYLLSVPPAYIAQSDAAMNRAIQLADTAQRKARVAKLKEMWDFYKASIITYQGEELAAKTNLQTEQQALELLEKTEEVLKQIGIRQQRLAAFARDPLHADAAGYINQSPNTKGGNWGTALLWTLQPWAEKSPRVKTRLQHLARSSDATVSAYTNILLHFANKNYTPAISNASFEEGTQNWRLWDKANEAAIFHRGEWTVTTEKANSGKHSLRIKGLRRGGPVSSIPYKAGNYFAQAYCYVPEGSKMGTARLTLNVSGNDNANARYPLPSSDIPLKPGTWSRVVVPFTLPVGRGATGVSLLLAVDGFEPDGIIYLDDVGIYRIGGN